MSAFSTRQRVNRKIARFALTLGISAIFLTAAVYIAAALPDARRARETNSRALEEVDCGAASCEIQKFMDDSEFDGPDYIIETRGKFSETKGKFLIVSTRSTADSPGVFPPLNYMDPRFFARFQQPAWYSAPDGVVWRLYSKETSVEGMDYQIVVGYEDSAPWRIERPRARDAAVDQVLADDANEIERNRLTSRGAPLRAVLKGLKIDGYAVIERDNGKVLTSGGQFPPAFLPADRRLPPVGWQPYIYEGALYVLFTDANATILVSTFVTIGGLWSIAGSCAFAFFVTGIAAELLGRRFLRTYFATRASRVPTLEEAQKIGEGLSIEFKRGLSEAEEKQGSVEEEILKSVAAFANTNDGVIFIGIDDAGRLKGLNLDFKQKDRMEQKIRQLVRNRIRPTPPIQIAFEDQRGLIFARIVVARGDDPVYLLNGVIYVRYGSSDVQAQPEDLKRLMAEY